MATSTIKNPVKGWTQIDSQAYNDHETHSISIPTGYTDLLISFGKDSSGSIIGGGNEFMLRNSDKTIFAPCFISDTNTFNMVMLHMKPADNALLVKNVDFGNYMRFIVFSR